MKGPGGLWRSDQGDLRLEAGGAACARADAGQHGYLRAACGAVAASPRMLGFGAPAQDALQMPTPPLPPQLRLHLTIEEAVEDGHHETLERAHDKFEDHFHLGLEVVGEEGKHDIVNSKQGDEQKRGLGQPRIWAAIILPNVGWP